MSERPRIPPLVAGLLILLAFGAALVLGSGPGTSEPAPLGPEVEPFEESSPEEIAERIAGIRSLEFEEVTEVRMLEEEEFANRVRRSAARSERRDRPELEQAIAVQTLLKLGGLADPDFDVQQAAAGLGELIGGFYAARKNRLVIIEQALEAPRGREQTTAHELEHALQDQHFPRVLREKRTEEESSEQDLAISALVEGDATVVEQRYSRRYLGLDQLDVDKSLLSPANVGSELPPVLVASVRFPYTAGTDFVAALRRRGGWPLVDLAFADPPTTSEQILHPGKWLAGEGAEKVPAVPVSALGPGWEPIGSTDSGELDAIVILASGVPADLAERAAKGWDGGRFDVFRKVGTESCAGVCRQRRAAAITYRFETEADTAEFAAAAGVYLRTLVPRRAAQVEVRGHTATIAFAPTPGLARRLEDAALAESGS